MKKSTTETKATSDNRKYFDPLATILKHFKSLTTYMAQVARGTNNRHGKFSLCVKASASKCFEFNLAVPDFTKSETAFFAMSSLRGICEDLIVLR